MMMMAIEGHAWVFPQDDINTDQIHLSIYSHLPIAEQAKHCLETLDPAFARSVAPGDIVIAGRNFGCGSARPAHLDLLELGVAAVVAESVDRKFFGNALSGGLPALACPGVLDSIRAGDRVRVDLATATIHELVEGRSVVGIPLPDFARAMLRLGGEKEYLRSILAAPASSQS
jgi:3-isopropylmalate/(R)-2-methylmalate dehydratase small subunit